MSIIDEAFLAVDKLERLIAEIEKYELRVYPDDLIREPQLVRRAFDILNSDAPMATEFKDGSKANPPYTPRQVFALAGFSRKLITHRDEEYDRVVREVHEELGRHEKRQCEGKTKAGEDCRSFAMAYAKEPRCYGHASEEDRKLNKTKTKIEGEMFRERLAMLSGL